MKLILPILILLMSSVGFADFNTEVDRVYMETLEIVSEDFPGEIAKDMSMVASLRCVHENGTEKRKDYSVPGLGCGGWNREVVNGVLKKKDFSIDIGKVYDSEGMCMISLKGDKAHGISAACIASLFDFYIRNFKFKEEDLWSRLKVYSYLGSCGNKEYLEKYKENRPEVLRILKKCNRMYGPGVERIERGIK